MIINIVENWINSEGKIIFEVEYRTQFLVSKNFVLFSIDEGFRKSFEDRFICVTAISNIRGGWLSWLGRRANNAKVTGSTPVPSNLL